MVIACSRKGLPPIEIGCFYEELPLLGVGLVSWGKARQGPKY